MTGKGFCVLAGFIKRHFVNFGSPNYLMALYNALVRSILKFGSVVWLPYTASLIQRIDRVQNYIA